MTGRFWIYAKMEEESGCSLYFGDEDDKSMQEIQPVDLIDQQIDQERIYPNWVTLSWKQTQKSMTLVSGFKTRTDNKYPLYLVHEGRAPFSRVTDKPFEQQIVLPSTWLRYQTTNYDVFDLTGSRTLPVDDKFFIIANVNELWSLKHTSAENFKLEMSKVGKVDTTREGKPVPDVTLYSRFLYFAPLASDENTTVVLSTDGTVEETFVIHKFNTTTSTPLTRTSKIVEYKKPGGGTKFYFYFLVREHVTTDTLTDLNPNDAPSREIIELDRVYLYRCCAHECMRKEIHGAQNQANTDTWKDPEFLMTNPFYPRGLFVGTPSSIVLILDDLVTEIITIPDPFKERVRLLLTNGLNVIYEICPAGLAETDTRCSISMYSAQRQETKTLFDNVAPDSFVVNSKPDGSEVEFLFQNATGPQFITLSTDISAGCSPVCVHGKCVLEDKTFVCKCEGNFAGDSCNTCKGDYSGPNCDILCTAENCQHGECKKDEGCVCDNSPEKGYWTYLDDSNLCGTCKFNLDPAKGCKKGECKPNYFGESCERYCYPPSTCSNHGACSSTGYCLCYEDPKLGHWSGYQCEKCLSNFAPSTGCTTCLPGFSGVNCTRAECYGVPASSPGVCSGRGKCIDGRCECNDEDMFFGFQCERFHCFGVENESPRACSGHGACVSPDQCLCRDGWTGENCSKEYSIAIMFWSGVIIVILSSVFFGACSAIVWKKYKSGQYSRKGFMQLQSGGLDDMQLHDMNREIDSETEDFDTASGSENDDGVNYDTDDDALKHDTF